MALSSEREQKGDERRRREEALKLCFEYFKHLTTLSGAAALVVLAISNATGLYWFQWVPSLVMFGVCISLSLQGMQVALTAVERGTGHNLNKRLATAGGLVIGGVAALTVFSVPVSP